MRNEILNILSILFQVILTMTISSFCYPQGRTTAQFRLLLGLNLNLRVYSRNFNIEILMPYNGRTTILQAEICIILLAAQYLQSMQFPATKEHHPL